MANFKKGVALVLAAATAFTFAPVSTLGTPVVAEAATTKAEINAGSTTGSSIGAAYITSGASNSFTVTGGFIYANWNANDKDEVTLSNHNVVVAKNAQDVVVKENATQINPAGRDTSLVNDANHTYTLPSTNASYTLNATVNKLKNGAALVTGDYANLKYTVSSSDTNVVYFGSENAKKDSATADLTSTSLSQPIHTGIAGDAKVTVSVTGEIKSGLFAGQKVTLASQDVYFTVAKADSGNIQTVYLKDGNGDLVKQVPAATDPYDLVSNGFNGKTTFATYSMSTVLGSLKTATIVTTTAESAALTYASSDTSVATVDAQGVITAVGKGNADITVTASSSASYTAQRYTIKVTVGTTVVKDQISVKDDKGAYIVKNNVVQKAIDMDPSTSTATTAVKTFQPVVTSDVQGTLTYAITDVNGNALSGNAALSASVDKATGLITAGDHTGTVYLQITSTSKSVTTNNGVTVVRVPVVINEKPQDTLTVNPTVINLDLAVNKTATFTAAGTTADTNVNRYSAVKYATGTTPNIAGENYNAVVLNESTDGTFTVTAKETGTITIQVKEAAIKDKTRDTYAYVVVNVTKDAAKTASTLAVKNSAIVLEAGKTAEIGATADTAITYTVADTSIATVDNATGVVTAVAAGNTYVTVTAATTDKVEGKTITVPVVVAAPAPVVVKPAKVTGVKIANVKGAKVKVSFKKVSKAAGYVVTYKIGKKSYKKTVTATSVKLSVKKGATVKVSVKAFNYKNGNVKQYGAASKTVSKKTDKK